MNRVYSVDFLRGLMAILVMCYHFVSWGVSGLDSSSLFSRFGLYAVTIFYLISGYSLAYVYFDRDVRVKSYLFSRFFRIAPLFYLVSIIFMSKLLLTGADLTFYGVFLNFSFLFSLFDPGEYLATGAWSIGNEMFFYCIFLIILKSSDSKMFLILFFIMSVLCLIYFRFYELDMNESLSSQWDLYINPMNHLAFFLFGVVTYVYRLNSWIKGGFLWVFVLTFVVAFYFYPVDGDRINIASGFNFLVFSLSSVSIFIVFIIANKFAFMKGKLSEWLGEISYSAYLVHPICWYVLKHSYLTFFDGELNYFVLFVFVIITLLVSSFSFRFFEKPIMNYGKKMINKGGLSRAS